MAKEKSTPEIVWADCKSCCRTTRHSVIFSHKVDSNDEQYQSSESWQIVQCVGCLDFGFRHRFDDYEDISEDEYGNLQHDIVITLYPKMIRNHKKLPLTWYMPPLIQSIYKQTLSAYGENAYVLASIGLRATIEAVCNHLSISGSNLEKRIDNLFRGGYVSNGDKNRLHAIRFLGNDAVHEIKQPKESELRVALEIVEHLLNTLFILERKSKKLEIAIDTYDDFVATVLKNLEQTEPSQLMSLPAILGPKRRLIGQYLPAFELKLIQEITAGNFSRLSIGPVQPIDGKSIQLYNVVPSP